MRATATVTPHGDVMPCNCTHVSMGNLCDDSLETILGRGRKVGWFDGQYPGCLVSENMEFIETVLPRINKSSKYPAPYQEVFSEIDDSSSGTKE